MGHQRHFEAVARESGQSEVLLVTESETEAIRRAQEHAGGHPQASVVVNEEYFDAGSRRFVGRRVWSCRGRPIEEKKSFVMSTLTGRSIVKR